MDKSSMVRVGLIGLNGELIREIIDLTDTCYDEFEVCLSGKNNSQLLCKWSREWKFNN